MRVIRAFSIVEILVVISIISLLISLLLPAIAKSKDSAIAAQCLSDKRQIAVSLQY